MTFTREVNEIGTHIGWMYISPERATRTTCDRDGQPANFVVGVTYPAADFAALSGLPSRARVKITGGKACKKDGSGVAIVGAGKCFMKVTAGKKSARVAVTVYSA